MGPIVALLTSFLLIYNILTFFYLFLWFLIFGLCVCAKEMDPIVTWLTSFHLIYNTLTILYLFFWFLIFGLCVCAKEMGPIVTWLTSFLLSFMWESPDAVRPSPLERGAPARPTIPPQIPKRICKDILNKINANEQIIQRYAEKCIQILSRICNAMLRKCIEILSRICKTLPKAQRTRGLSSYHKLLHKSWSNNSKTLIKH